MWLYPRKIPLSLAAERVLALSEWSIDVAQYWATILASGYQALEAPLLARLWLRLLLLEWLNGGLSKALHHLAEAVSQGWPQLRWQIWANLSTLGLADMTENSLPHLLRQAGENGEFLLYAAVIFRQAYEAIQGADWPNAASYALLAHQSFGQYGCDVERQWAYALYGYASWAQQRPHPPISSALVYEAMLAFTMLSLETLAHLPPLLQRSLVPALGQRIDNLGPKPQGRIVARLYNSLGALYFLQKEYDAANEAWRQAMQHCRQQQDTKGLMVVLYHLALLQHVSPILLSATHTEL